MLHALQKRQTVSLRPDKVGILISALLTYALLALPFVSFRPNRIVQGDVRQLWEAAPLPVVYGIFTTTLLAVVVAFFRSETKIRLPVACIALAGLVIGIGMTATNLTPSENTYARVSPASGSWVLLAGLILMATDAIARLRPSPQTRILFLGFTLVLLSLLLISGQWDDLSVMKEYQSRVDIFWLEAMHHIQLALGSLFAATIVGIPVGVICYKVPKLRAAVLNSLNIVQTIPSIALFGILIAPLGWIAANIPGASDLGIRGIGMAPAFVALFVYSLLPVVSNTVVGLDGVSPSVREAARGLGMTGGQRLFKVECPLALPIILTGIRIVLVQNIGLATIAALIGGGGFGVFVFQGIGQTAMDLVLLGTIPTVILGFSAAILLDAVVDSSLSKRGNET